MDGVTRRKKIGDEVTRKLLEARLEKAEWVWNNYNQNSYESDFFNERVEKVEWVSWRKKIFEKGVRSFLCEEPDLHYVLCLCRVVILHGQSFKLWRKKKSGSCCIKGYVWYDSWLGPSLGPRTGQDHAPVPNSLKCQPPTKYTEAKYSIMDCHFGLLSLGVHSFGLLRFYPFGLLQYAQNSYFLYHELIPIPELKP